MSHGSCDAVSPWNREPSKPATGVSCPYSASVDWRQLIFVPREPLGRFHEDAPNNCPITFTETLTNTNICNNNNNTRI